MADPSASYIHMVHRLIEACLVFNMSKDECMEALYKHANIAPVITSTVWNELEKENKEFFESYSRNRAEKKKKTGDDSYEASKVNPKRTNKTTYKSSITGVVVYGCDSNNKTKCLVGKRVKVSQGRGWRVAIGVAIGDLHEPWRSGT